MPGPSGPIRPRTSTVAAGVDEACAMCREWWRPSRRRGWMDALCATMKHMSEVGIRSLKQNASAVVARAAAGESVTVTDRGRPVARMTALPATRLEDLVEAGRARPARRKLADLPPPEPGPSVSGAL